MASTTTRRGPIRAAAAALCAALLLPLAATPVAADTTTTDAGEAAGGWLAAQLVDGERFESVFGDDVFLDHGLTADAVFALAASGVASGTIASATDWLATEVEAYTGADDEVWAGATAKVLLVAAVAGRDGTAFGGVDLPAKLLGREQEDGRFTDVSSFGDFSNVITQSLAVLALERTTDGPSDAAVGFLADAACDDGGFPVQFGTPCASSVDGTGFAVQALAAVGGHDAAVAAAADWLTDQQARDGSFSSPDGVNANSTGLASVALTLAGREAQADAARDWLLTTQDGCGDPEPGAIPFNREDRGDVVRATTQALPGLVGASLATITAAGASASLPTLDCEPQEAPAERDVAVTCAQDEVRPGDDVDCDVSGLLPGDEVRVTVTVNPTLLDDTFTADDDGGFGFSFTVPADTAPGATITIAIDGVDVEVDATLTLQVVAADDTAGGGEGGGPAPIADEDDVEPVAAQDELPATGAGTELLAIAGLLALATGSWLVVRGPRLRRTS